MKRITYLILVTIILLSACGGGSQSNVTTTATTAAATTAATTTTAAATTEKQTTAAETTVQSDEPIWSAPNVLPIVKDTVKYRVLGTYFPGSVPLEENLMMQEYEGMTNVDIQWESVANDDQQTRLALSLTSGDYPDAYFNFFMSTAQQLIYGQQGIIIPLQDMIADQGPNVTAIYKLHPDIKSTSTAPDGNIYSLFQYDPALHMRTNQKMYINQQWLKDSGYEMPATIEEFADVLRYFRDNDMNGNGDPNDEIPLAGYKDTDPAKFLINSFILNVNRGLLIVDDKVTPIFNTEEYRDALRYVNSLYKEGLIGKETYTMDLNSFQAMMNRPEELIVGAVGTSMYQGFFMNIELFLDNLGAETYCPVPPLVGPLGKAQTPYTDDGILVGRSIQITNVAKNPTILVKWLDWFYDETNCFWQMNGYEGIDWEYVDEESISGQKPAHKFIPGMNPDKNRIIMNQGAMYYTNELRYREAKVPGSGGLALYEDSMVYLPFQDMNQKYLPFTVWQDEESARTRAQLETMFNDYVNESRARFVVGELNIESDWDSYISELNAMDLEAYVAIWQKIYDVANK